MAVTRGFIIPWSALIQHHTAGQDKREVSTLLTGLCDSQFNMLAARTGDSNGWGCCGFFFIFFELFTKHGEAVNEDGASTRNAWCAQTLHMASAFILNNPVKIQRASLIRMLSSQLGGQGMQAAPLVFNFKSHILSLRTQRSWPLLAMEFHMQK